VQIELMRGIKRLFDPGGILNPGKIFDPGPGAAP
jgi:FAD/FMN-containing dehydrogenase